MRTVRRWTLGFALTVAMLGLDAMAAELPTEIKLTSGAVLRKCSVVRWGSDYVVIKHVGGTDPIRFAYIAAEQREKVIALRDGDKASDVPSTPAPGAADAADEAKRSVTISGSAYSGGVDQPYRFAGMHVYLVPQSMAEAWRQAKGQKMQTPTAAAEVVTDVDGKFSAVVPKGDYVLFANQLRSYRNGNRVVYTWAVDVQAIKPLTLTLNDDNARYELSDIGIIRK